MSLLEQNFRDLGGMPTKYGETVQSGVLYRCSSPSRFTAEELAEFDRFGMETLVDLRTTRELEMPRNRFNPDAARVLHIPLIEHVRENWKAPRDQTPPATAGRYYEMLNDGLAALVNVMKALSEGVAYPAVVFCGAGRDRTGIVLGCLLDLLDVEEEEIASDYAASDAFFNDGGRAFGPTMLELLELIRGDHGNTAGMLAKKGLSPDEVEALRVHFLNSTA